jgi:hypothetical protein
MGKEIGGPAPWFAESGSAELGAEYGEDVTFCLRAGVLGFKLHVHTGVEVGHIKMGATLDLKSYHRYLEEVAAQGEEAVSEANLARLGRIPRKRQGESLGVA